MNLSSEAWTALGALVRGEGLIWVSQRGVWAESLEGEGFARATVNELLSEQLARWSHATRSAVFPRPDGVRLARDCGLDTFEHATQLLEGLASGGGS